MTTLEKIKKECLDCCACPLYSPEKNKVFSSRDDVATILMIGEAPGEKEDLMGEPFVGMAGKLMNGYFELAGLSREKDIYITNIVKCRPPNNRKPKSVEKDACLGFLLRQIEYVNPKVIILCGGTALEAFVKNTKISEVHGQLLKIKIGDKIYDAVPVYHPSPLCRVENKKEIMVQDLTKIKNLVLN